MNGYFHLLTVLHIIISMLKCDGIVRRNNSRDKIKIPKDKEDSKRHVSYVNDVIDELCLPRGTNKLFYRNQNESHIFVGFDDVKHGLVYSMSWKIYKKTPEKLTVNKGGGFQILSATDVRKQLKLEHLLAAADQKVQDKFQMKISSCSGRKITSKACVIQSIARIARKMKEVRFGQNLGRYCNKTNDVDFSTLLQKQET